MPKGLRPKTPDNQQPGGNPLTIDRNLRQVV